MIALAPDRVKRSGFCRFSMLWKRKQLAQDSYKTRYELPRGNLLAVVIGASWAILEGDEILFERLEGSTVRAKQIAEKKLRELSPKSVAYAA